MTERLELAINKASDLPEDQQNELAALILAEIESETAWRIRFSDSIDVLNGLGKEAWEDLREGSTKPLEFPD